MAEEEAGESATVYRRPEQCCGVRMGGSETFYAVSGFRLLPIPETMRPTAIRDDVIAISLTEVGFCNAFCSIKAYRSVRPFNREKKKTVGLSSKRSQQIVGLRLPMHMANFPVGKYQMRIHSLDVNSFVL